MKSNRIEWLDTVKFICIIFVITVHLEADTELLHSFFQPFFLIGFLFVSGYCYKNGNDFSSVLRKKITQLFIPWLVWGFIKISSQQMYSVFGAVSHELSFGERIKRLLLQIRGIDDPVWFVAMMFVSFIPFYFLIRAYESSGNKKTYKWLLLVLYLLGEAYSAYMPPFSYGTNALPWHIEYFPTSLLFMFLGYEYRNVYEPMLKEKESHVFPYISVLYLLLFLVSCFCPVSAPFAIVFQTVRRLIGVAFLVLLSKRIRPDRYILFVGQNTLTYFPMHIYVYTLAEAILRKAVPDIYTAILNNVMLSSCFALFSALLISVILIIPAKIINKYFPFMAGKKYSRSAA